METDRLENLIQKVIRELEAAGLISRRSEDIAGKERSLPEPAFNQPVVQVSTPELRSSGPSPVDLQIDLEDPTKAETRHNPGIAHPADVEGLQALMNTTTARIGLGRAGTRSRTASWLLFQADLAVTQDTLYHEVDAALLKDLDLFTVTTCISGGKQEYLLRPDLGRRLNEEAKGVIRERCSKKPDVQVCVGDGLSAAAVEANLRKIFPVLQNGCKIAGLSLGTPFFIQYCRVGVMNDIGDLLEPDVLILLIGERPGLGRAESLSAYMAYRPHEGQTDADRDVICNIYDSGGTNPLEAGAYAVQLAQKMILKQASGVDLEDAGIEVRPAQGEK